MAMPDDDPLRGRKDAHLDLCARGAVEPEGNDALFGDVHLVHDCLPELAIDEVDPSCEFLGKRLACPLLITGMTGGTERAGRVNRQLAGLAEEFGIAFGLGSQRAMAGGDAAAAASFAVRTQAPGTALLGNIGLWQARELGVDGVRRLMDAVGADGLAVHLNAAQEMIQPEGDRDFRGGLDLLGRLAASLGDRLVVKETGCGMSPASARRLIEAGVRWLDVSGLGGTSWVRVEALRAMDSAQQLGMTFSGWGIPTAASVYSVARVSGERARLIASGGIRDGLAAAKSLSLGASMAGVALPVFRALEAGGVEGARGVLAQLVAGVKLAMVLTGSRRLVELQASRPVLTGQMKQWCDGLTTAADQNRNPDGR